MKIIYKRLPNNKRQYFNRKLRRYYNRYVIPVGRVTSHDNRGTKILLKQMGKSDILKGTQAVSPLRKNPFI